MKKVLSAIMVMAILLTSAVSVFAGEGTRFISYYSNYYLLTEDGRIYNDVYNNFDLEQNYGPASSLIEFFDYRDKKISPQHFFGNMEYLFSEDHTLYSVHNDGAVVCENVQDFIMVDPEGYGRGTVLYRDANSNLYHYDRYGKSTLLLENCSNIYDGISWQSTYDSYTWYRMYFAKTNDNQWYHWGENEDYRLESQKMVDGNDITPYEFEKPIPATEFVYKYEISNNSKNIFKTVEWNLDGCLYINGEKIADNICAVSEYHYDRGDVRFTTYDGDVISVEYDGYKFTVSIFDTNFSDLHDYESGIDKSGNFTYIDENNTIKTVRANYKYLNRSDWANAEIASADEIGYIDSVKLFNMQSNIKREDFCNMIVDFCEKYMGRELSTTTNPFEDTENEKVIKAYANGIITGVSSDRFAPDDKITREQMCAIMTRATKFLKPDVQFGQGIAFSDMHTVSDWAVEGVNAMSGLGIVKGDGYSITPQSNTSVEQAIAMTYRLYNKIK